MQYHTATFRMTEECLNCEYIRECSWDEWVKMEMQNPNSKSHFVYMKGCTQDEAAQVIANGKVENRNWYNNIAYAQSIHITKQAIWMHMDKPRNRKFIIKKFYFQGGDRRG